MAQSSERLGKLVGRLGKRGWLVPDLLEREGSEVGNVLGLFSLHGAELTRAKL